MTETAVQETVAATPVKTPKKKTTAPKAKGASKPKAPAAHPPTAQMVNNAIKNLKERGGSSLQAIKKYIAGTYKVDAEKLSPFIKKYLKSAVDGGKLIRTKGKGASGSFKLADTKKTEKKVVKPKAVKKPKATTTKPKKPKAEKSAATPKKPKATKPKAASKPKAAAPKKSPSKVKKAARSPAAKKPKSPKPKKTAPRPNKVAAKKPAAKK